MPLGQVAAAVAILALTGCAVKTSSRVPTAQLPESYYAGKQDPALTSQKADLSRWWTNFHDAKLDELVERAISGNLDLRVAKERVREARAVSGSVIATRRLPNTAIIGGASDRNTSSLFQTGFDASYELDLFGGARASVRAAEADAQAVQESVNDSLVTVVAETARNYLELRASQERLQVAKNTLTADNETLRLTKLRQSAGLTSELDPTRAQARVESTKAAITAQEQRAQLSINAIALLLGEQPGKLQAELAADGDLPASPPEIPVGLPSDLLRRRPDVRRAERDIAASSARVGVAVSNLYPKFSLTTNTGAQSSTLANLLSGAANIWSLGSSFSWGLLNYPATKANIQASESRERQSMTNYEKSVLTALRDVEDALTSYTKEKERQKSLVQAAEANRKAAGLATMRYKSGLSNFLDVLDARRSLYTSEDSLVQSRAAVTTNLVALYKALGGGW